MNGDWPRLQAVIQTYKLFLSEYFHGMLLIHMLKALDQDLQQKVIKEPKPATLEEAIQRTWRVFHTAQPHYHSQRLPMQIRHRTSRQLPRQYMFQHQRPQGCIWTRGAWCVRIRVYSPSEHLTRAL